MSQNVITTEDMEYMPVLTLVTTDAPYQAKASKPRVAKLDSKTIVIEFPATSAETVATAERSRNKAVTRLFDAGMIALISSSAVAAGYSLLTLAR